MQLTPRIIVRDADRAIGFYEKVFGAEVLERFAMPDGLVVHAALRIGESILALAGEKVDWHNASPQHLGGTPVILNLQVDDADAVGARLEAEGAEVVFPIDDQFYGKREGRFRDPFGHFWIVSQVVEELTPEEIEARMG